MKINKKRSVVIVGIILFCMLLCSNFNELLQSQATVPTICTFTYVCSSTSVSSLLSGTCGGSPPVSLPLVLVTGSCPTCSTPSNCPGGNPCDCVAVVNCHVCSAGLCPTSTPTPSPPPVCGNNVVEPPEQCDPPGTICLPLGVIDTCLPSCELGVPQLCPAPGCTNSPPPAHCIPSPTPCTGCPVTILGFPVSTLPVGATICFGNILYTCNASTCSITFAPCPSGQVCVGNVCGLPTPAPSTPTPPPTSTSTPTLTSTPAKCSDRTQAQCTGTGTDCLSSEHCVWSVFPPKCGCAP